MTQPGDEPLYANDAVTAHRRPDGRVVVRTRRRRPSLPARLAVAVAALADRLSPPRRTAQDPRP